VVLSGSEIGPGYWVVTLAAEVREPPPADDSGGAAGEAGEAGAGSGAGGTGEGEADDAATSGGAETWYLELGVVGDPEDALAAVTAPAVLPSGPPVPEGWEIESSLTRLDDDDPVVLTIDGFLQAMLADGGDPGRYLAPGLDLDPPSSPLFAEVAVDTVEVTEIDAATIRAHVWVTGTTAAGTPHRLRYQLTLGLRDDRWEVAGLSGAPAVEQTTGGAS
jgi:hypothetical protein